MHLYYDDVNVAFADLVTGIDNQRYPTVLMPSRNGVVMAFSEPLTVTYKQPQKRVLFNTARDCNPFFHLYESLWMLVGREDVNPLRFYNSKIADFSDDGETFNGAYGRRWRYGLSAPVYADDVRNPERVVPLVDEGRTEYVDQIDFLIDHLTRDPFSRRAVLQMWTVGDDLVRINSNTEAFSKDTCCNTNIYFRVQPSNCSACYATGRITSPEEEEGEHRTIPCPRCEGTGLTPGSLDMTVCNRSNDIVWGMLGANVVHMSFLQEYMAGCLGLRVGQYHQLTNNAHVYSWNWEPDKWLQYYTSPTDMHQEKALDYETLDRWQPLSLIDTPPVRFTFDAELSMFVATTWTASKDKADINNLINFLENFSFRTNFIEHVAKPMCLGFMYHKIRDYDAALAVVQSDVQALDWRYAGTRWLQKRKQRYSETN